MVEKNMLLLKHLEELRRVFLVSFIAIAISTVGCFFFSDQILEIFTRPLEQLGYSLYIIGMTEGIYAKLKIALLAGIIVSSPVLMWEFWHFLVPALYPHERKYILKLVPISVILFVLGVAFAYYIVFPVAIYILIKMAGEMEPMLTISKFISFTLSFLIPFGLLFELPVIIHFLTWAGVVTPAFLTKNRGYAIVVSFIIAAMLTPGPDPISQLVMVIPMIILYEAGILVAKITTKRKKSKLQEKD